MQQYFTLGDIKGYAGPMLYYKSYITQPNYINNRAIVDFRIEVLRHAEKFGIASALDAYHVSRSTYFLWKKKAKLDQKKRGGFINLCPKSTRPKTFRKSKVDCWYKEQILAIRKTYPRLGKNKIKPLLDEICHKSKRRLISESTIGRLIGELKRSNQLAQFGKVTFSARTGRILSHKDNKSRIDKQRRGKYLPKEPGDLVQIDCVIKFYHGLKRYIVSGIDYKTSFAYSFAYTKLSSATSTDFLHKFQSVAPFEIKHIQTDNGSEFMDKFHADLGKQGLTHFFNYPRHPKSNGKIERYNRTIQDEFIDANIEELFDNIGKFNQSLTDWLLYYNTKRPHFAHRDPDNKRIQIPPMRAFIYMLKLDVEKSNMCWTQTRY